MRTLALDLSSTRSGWAVGEPGSIPDEWGVISRPGSIREEPEVLQFMTEAVLEVARRFDVQFAVSEEMNYFSRREDPSKNKVNARTVRMLCGIRGAVMFALKAELSVDLQPLNLSSCRSAAGVDLSRDAELPIKIRVMERLASLGFETTEDNIADAVVVLIGAKSVLGKQEEEDKATTKPRLSW